MLGAYKLELLHKGGGLRDGEDEGDVGGDDAVGDENLLVRIRKRKLGVWSKGR